MHILVVFQKSNRKLLATFELNTFITEMNALTAPGVSYLVTTEKDIFHTEPNGDVYVKET